jgi:hypothetical protein
MSTSRTNGIISFVCDSCGYRERGKARTFFGFWNDLKTEGWECCCDDGERWQHFCPDCAEGFFKE